MTEDVKQHPLAHPMKRAKFTVLIEVPTEMYDESMDKLDTYFAEEFVCLAWRIRGQELLRKDESIWDEWKEDDQ